MKNCDSANRNLFRLAVLATHPIQYQVPLFRKLAAHPAIDLTVLFCSDWGVKPYRDEGFEREVKWDVPLLDGYRFIFLPNISPIPSSPGFWGRVNPGVCRYLRNGYFDAVWVHGWATVTDWLAMLKALSSNVPLLLRGEANGLSAPQVWKSWIKRAVFTRLFQQVSGFLAIGRYNTEFYEAHGVPKDKIFLVPYAVDNEFFLSKAEELLPHRWQIRLKLGMPTHLPVIMFVGKLLGTKRPMDLLKAFAQLSTYLPVALVYVGDGPMRGDLQAYADEHHLQHVYFMGFRNQSELPNFYAVADVVVLPSVYEPWGLVINEAMCFGLPVIVSDRVGAAGDLVNQGINGFVFPSGDVPVLAKYLEQLLSDNDLRRRMGDASLKAIKPWSYQACTEGLMHCLSELH